MTFRSLVIATIFSFFLLIISCFKPNQITNPKKEIITLKKIQTRGTLHAVTFVNSTSYFLFKGIPLGFHYELLKQFSDHLGVKLEITTAKNLQEAFDLLDQGKCDLIAHDLTITEKRKNFLSFSIPIYYSSEVIVYQKNKSNPFKNNDPINIHVPENSSFVETARQLNLNYKINIIEEKNLLQEELIKQVSEGKIDYTIADMHIARLLCYEFPNISYQMINQKQIAYAWSVDKNSLSLLEELNKWLKEFQKTPLFRYWFKKYFESPRHQNYFDKYLSSEKNKISRYDNLFKKYAKDIKWDWRLFAALAYQESQFQENLRSPKGAFGLMQMMPATCKHFGIDSLSNAESQIKAGAKYIQYLDKCFSMIPDSAERIKFILASYNSGPGHVYDAMRLTEKYNKNKHLWDNNVDSFMLKKAYPKYYRDPVVRNGYSRGYESFKFVREVIERYLHYKNFVPN